MPDWLCCLTTVVLFYVIPKGSSMQVNYLLSMFWIGYFVRKYHEQFEHIRMVVTITATIGLPHSSCLGYLPIIMNLHERLSYSNH